MRSQDRQVIDLFGGPYALGGYRGRTTAPISRRPSQWAIALLCTCLFGFTTAAAAITIHKARGTDSESVTHSLSGNLGVKPFGSGFEEALY